MKIKNIIVNDSLNDCLDVSYGIYEIDNLYQNAETKVCRLEKIVE